MKIPILVPLGNGSKRNNDELRILLRSIETHLRGYGEIYLMTKYPPDWIQNVTVVELDDPCDSCKDYNLHYKTLKTLEMYDLDEFLWTADDAVIAQDVFVRDIPVLYNVRDRESFFKDGVNTTKWRRRVQNTFKYLDTKGIHLNWNYEVHAPQVFPGKLLLEKMKDIDYKRQPGLTIYTTWRGVTDTWHNAQPQPSYKATYEIAIMQEYKTDDLGAKMFVGYNDQCFLGGLRERLLDIYKEKSIYEK